MPGAVFSQQESLTDQGARGTSSIPVEVNFPEEASVEKPKTSYRTKIAKIKKSKGRPIRSLGSLSDTSSFFAPARTESNLDFSAQAHHMLGHAHILGKLPDHSVVSPPPEFLTTPRPDVGLSVTSVSMSDSSDPQVWIEAYEQSPLLRYVLQSLRAGYDCHPYTLSEDGLLYAYIQDSRSAMEVARLVPPEGDIRDKLVRDAVAEMKAAHGTKLVGRKLAEKTLDSLSEEYWWGDMEAYIRHLINSDA